MNYRRGRTSFCALAVAMLAPFSATAGKEPALPRAKATAERPENLRPPETRACYSFPGQPECLRSVRRPRRAH